MFKCEWFLVVVGRLVVGVYGSALREDAEKSAQKHGGEIVHIGSYGFAYHCGDRLPV